MRPVLLVHGINDTHATFARMANTVRDAGAPAVKAIDLQPNDGSAPIPQLAEQVDAAARELLQSTGAERLDVVGFSMGSLVSRYWLQRLGGRERTRTFVSISGPHAGTWLAHLSAKPGIRDMRPGSPLLVDLESDPEPWGDVRVHVFWTPLDLMIVPAKSCMLSRAHSVQSFPVILHPLMLSDRRVIQAVVAALKA